MLCVAIRTAAGVETAEKNINVVIDVTNYEDKPAHGFQQMFQAIVQ